jgi:hypothetical protein
MVAPAPILQAGGWLNSLGNDRSGPPTVRAVGATARLRPLINQEAEVPEPAREQAASAEAASAWTLAAVRAEPH